MTIWLLKTEPDDYAYDDLVRDTRTRWTGVSNAAAQKAMRGIKKGDEAFIYHTGKEKRIAGLAEIASDPYPDPKQDDEKLVVFDLKPKAKATKEFTLADAKADERFEGFALVRQPRLSAMEVPADLAKIIRAGAGL